LSIEELTKLTYLDLSDKGEKWNIVRDIYCFNAFTCGMRVKDLMRLKEHNIVTKIVDGEKIHYLTFKQSKTGKPVKAPISNIGMEILEKYDGKLPHLKSDVESNEILKKLGKMCGFTDYLDPIVDNKNNILVKKRKYELITNHSARRSFCTNTYNQGVDIMQIMAISGHSSPNVLLGYIGVTLDEYADKMLDTKYFKSVDNITQDYKMKAV
jgi:integrase